MKFVNNWRQRNKNCKLVRGRKAVERHMNVTHLYAELKVPISKLSVDTRGIHFLSIYSDL